MLVTLCSPNALHVIKEKQAVPGVAAEALTPGFPCPCPTRGFPGTACGTYRSYICGNNSSDTWWDSTMTEAGERREVPAVRYMWCDNTGFVSIGDFTITGY